jgi:hypothetical protein
MQQLTHNYHNIIVKWNLHILPYEDCNLWSEMWPYLYIWNISSVLNVTNIVMVETSLLLVMSRK